MREFACVGSSPPSRDRAEVRSQQRHRPEGQRHDVEVRLTVAGGRLRFREKTCRMRASMTETELVSTISAKLAQREGSGLRDHHFRTPRENTCRMMESMTKTELVSTISAKLAQKEGSGPRDHHFRTPREKPCRMIASMTKTEPISTISAKLAQKEGSGHRDHNFRTPR